LSVLSQLSPFGLLTTLSLGSTIHLEELTFWLFIIHQGPSPRDWWSSWEFSIWKLGAFLAALTFPTLALIVRHDVLAGDAYIFVLGASLALAVTLGFLPVLARFPTFLANVKAGGANGEAVGRLRYFWMLNVSNISCPDSTRLDIPPPPLRSALLSPPSSLSPLLTAGFISVSGIVISGTEDLGYSTRLGEWRPFLIYLNPIFSFHFE
jgi:hypothetical protein